MKIRYVHNDIIIKYTVEKRSLSYGKRLHRGQLKEIVECLTSKYGLDSSDVHSVMIRKRETRSDKIIVHRMHGGHISPMAKVEDNIVGLIVQITCIRHSLTPSSCL